MKGLVRTYVVSLAAWSLLALSGQAAAGMVEFEFNAGNFAPGAAIDNTYWPLSSGTSSVYFAESRDGCEVNQMTVTGNTKSDFATPYDSIVAWEVEDRAWVDEACGGNYALVESTKDWFAQDKDGNVWYFGEDTEAWDHDDGCPSTSGAWQAGDDGAVAGVVMPADPVVGTWYQQEFYEGEAEDRAKVLNLDANVSIGSGAFAGCLRTKEYSPLAPGQVEHKYYCPAVGLKLINELKGKTLRVEYIGDTLPLGSTFADDGVCPAP